MFTFYTVIFGFFFFFGGGGGVEGGFCLMLNVPVNIYGHVITKQLTCALCTYIRLPSREHSGSVVVCLTQDRGAAGLSLTVITMSLNKTH